LLTGLMAFMLTNNWFHPQLPVSISPGENNSWLIWLGTGIVFSQVAVVAAWITVSAVSLSQKVAFFIAIVLPLFVMEMIGYLFQLSQQQNVYAWQFSQVHSALAIVMITMLGMMPPLLVARMFLLVQRRNHKPVSGFAKRGFSLGTLLAFTALAGLTLSAVGSSELRQISPTSEKLGWLLVSWAVCGAFISIAATIPIAVLSLGCSRVKAIFGMVAITPLLTIAMMSYFSQPPGTKFVPRLGPTPLDCFLAVVGFMTAMRVFFIGIGLLGYEIRFAKYSESNPATSTE